MCDFPCFCCCILFVLPFYFLYFCANQCHFSRLSQISLSPGTFPPAMMKFFLCVFFVFASLSYYIIFSLHFITNLHFSPLNLGPLLYWSFFTLYYLSYIHNIHIYHSWHLMSVNFKWILAPKCIYVCVCVSVYVYIHKHTYICLYMT